MIGRVIDRMSADNPSRRGRTWSAALVGAGLMVQLAACAQPPGGHTQAGSPTADAAKKPAESVAALPPTPAVDADPERLLGLAPGDLEGLLGRPELVRRESPAQVWQYRTGACVLDVVLYDVAVGRQVTYVEARDRGGARVETRPCLAEVLRAQLDTPTS